MVIKELINVSDNRLLDGLVPVVRIMSQVEAIPKEEEVIIDFSDTIFITPVCALSLIVYFAGCGRKVMLRNVPEYLMISGSCIYVKSPGHDNVYSVPDGLRWNGTVVALRIPINSSVFNYINYID